VRDGESGFMMVRASAQSGGQSGLRPITDVRFYQQFFAALEKSMFLTAHQVE